MSHHIALVPLCTNNLSLQACYALARPPETRKLGGQKCLFLVPSYKEQIRERQNTIQHDDFPTLTPPFTSQFAVKIFLHLIRLKHHYQIVRSVVLLHGDKVYMRQV